MWRCALPPGRVARPLARVLVPPARNRRPDPSLPLRFTTNPSQAPADPEFALLRLLLLAHRPDVVFYPARGVSRGAGSERRDAILNILRDASDCLHHRRVDSDSDEDPDDRREPRAPLRAVPLSCPAFDNFDVALRTLRDFCGGSDANVGAFVALECQRQIRAAAAVLLAAVPAPGRANEDDGVAHHSATYHHGGADHQSAPHHHSAPFATDPARLRELSLDGYLRVDESTLASLGVFAPDPHPSSFVGVRKEWGAHALLDTCVTPRGRRLLAQWFRRPALNLEVLGSRLDAVAFFVRGEGDASRACEAALRAGAGADVDATLAAMARDPTRGTTSAEEWRKIDAFARMAERLANEIERCERETREAREAGGSGAGAGAFPTAIARFPALVAPVRHVRAVISAVIDLDRPRARGDAARPFGAARFASLAADDRDDFDDGYSERARDVGIVRPGACAELDDARRLLHGLPDLLARATRLETDRVPRVLRGRGAEDSMTVTRVPGEGFALAYAGGPMPPDVAEELGDVDFAFDRVDPRTGAYAAYYRTELTRELTDRLGDASARVAAMERAVLDDARRRVLADAAAIRACARGAAEIDAALSLARGAVAHGLVRPTLTEANVLDVRGARHLLHEAATGVRAVPNDATCGRGDEMSEKDAIGENANGGARNASNASNDPNGSYGNPRARVVVVTGPTMSGKSVYVKSVGLVAYLAHVGSFVPADSAVIGLMDRIFASASSACFDSLAARDGRSSFARDVDEASRILHAASDRSLLILDEFGKGTKTSDGIGLLAGFLRVVSEVPSPPRVFAATHFAEVADPTLVPRNANLRFVTMRVLQPERDEKVEKVVGSNPAPDANRPEPEREREDDAVFLYEVVPGVCDRAFSARCAREAGLPDAVMRRVDELARADDARRRVAGSIPGGDAFVVKPANVSAASVEREAAAARAVVRLAETDVDAPGALEALARAFEDAGV